MELSTLSMWLILQKMIHYSTTEWDQQFTPVNNIKKQACNGIEEARMSVTKKEICLGKTLGDFIISLHSNSLTNTIMTKFI